MNTRTLTLRREALTELGSADLASVRGAAISVGDVCLNTDLARNSREICWTDWAQTQCACHTEV